MTAERKGMLAKGLEAVGIAGVLVGLIQGVYGSDMWGELYFFLGGMLVFYIGRQTEKKLEKKMGKATEGAAGKIAEDATTNAAQHATEDTMELKSGKEQTN